MENCKSSRSDMVDVCCCGFCNKKYHKRCTQLSNYDVNLLKKGINIYFICEDCVQKFGIIKQNMENIVFEIKKNNNCIIEAVEKKISEGVDTIKKKFI